jgi:hypothetical protein
MARCERIAQTLPLPARQTAAVDRDDRLAVANALVRKAQSVALDEFHRAIVDIMSTFVVALEAGSLAATDLAPLLGITPYEANQRIAPGLPAVLLQTPDRARAVELTTRLRALGLQVSACDASAVVPLASMTALRDFRFEERALTQQGVDGRTLDTLPWDDVMCLIRAQDRTGERSTKIEKETTLSPMRVVASGGLIAMKTKTTEVTTNTEAREGVLVLFRKSGATPWILRETSARYGALEGERASTTLQNFGVAIARIRERAPHAPYDERLVARKTKELDLLVHLTAMACARAASSPYRGAT